MADKVGPPVIVNLHVVAHYWASLDRDHPASANRATTNASHLRISTLISSSPRPGSDGARSTRLARHGREYVGACPARVHYRGHPTRPYGHVLRSPATTTATRWSLLRVHAKRARPRERLDHREDAIIPRDDPARGEIRCRALDISRDDQEAYTPLTAGLGACVWRAR